MSVNNIVTVPLGNVLVTYLYPNPDVYVVSGMSRNFRHSAQRRNAVPSSVRWRFHRWRPIQQRNRLLTFRSYDVVRIVTSVVTTVARQSTRQLESQSWRSASVALPVALASSFPDPERVRPVPENGLDPVPGGGSRTSSPTKRAPDFKLPRAISGYLR
jgi:hypothetical protein